jgi:hypothetical protein
MIKIAVYARNPAIVLHPVLRVEVVRSMDVFQKALDDDLAVDISDHKHSGDIDNAWFWHDEHQDFVRGA